MAIVFKNGKWFDTELNKVVNSPFSLANRSGPATDAALRAKNTNLANAYDQLSGLPGFNTNQYEISGYQTPVPKGGFDGSRFTQYGNRFSKSLDDYLKGDYFKSLYDNTHGGKKGWDKWLNKESLNLIKTGSDIFGNVSKGVAAMSTASTAREEMIRRNALDKANFYTKVSDYNTKAGLLNEKLVADGRKPVYKTMPTTYGRDVEYT